MKKTNHSISFRLFLFLLFYAAGSAHGKTLLYQGSWHSVPCSVTINWSNYSGLGPVDGEIYITGDKSYRFTGSNSAPGKLEIRVPGDPVYQFYLEKQAGKSVWIVEGGGISFSRKTTAPPKPAAPKKPVSLPVPRTKPFSYTSTGKRDPETTMYFGTWGGNPVSVTIHWDNYSGLGPVAGHIVYNNSIFPFTGKNSSRGFLAIQIEGVKEECRLDRSDTGSWSGMANGSPISFQQSVSLVSGRKSSIPVSSRKNWLIACEASRDRINAERRATAWRNKGFPGACVVHKSEYQSLNGDQNWWITCPGRGSREEMESLLPRVKVLFPTAYGIKADQSEQRETFH